MIVTRTFMPTFGKAKAMGTGCAILSSEWAGRARSRGDPGVAVTVQFIAHKTREPVAQDVPGGCG